MRIPKTSAGSPTPDAIYHYTLTPACPQAQPLDDLNCAIAAAFCAANGESGLHEDVWREETLPVFEAWRIVSQVCVGPRTESTPIADVEARVSEYE
ncbi:MAG TPA: hypothetical protein VF218_05555, partial [Acidothermaceae bacterium]